MPRRLAPMGRPVPFRSRRRLAFLALVGAAVVVLAATACSRPSDSSGGQAGSSPAAQGAADAAGAAQTFTAATLDGEQVTVPGAKPSVLLFFSVECGGCGPTAQDVAKVQKSVGDKANFVAVDVAGYETEADVKAFLTNYEATTLAYAIDSDAQWIRAYGINQLSLVTVLDASGKEVFRAVEPAAEQVKAELAKVTA